MSCEHALVYFLWWDSCHVSSVLLSLVHIPSTYGQATTEFWIFLNNAVFCGLYLFSSALNVTLIVVSIHNLSSSSSSSSQHLNLKVCTVLMNHILLYDICNVNIVIWLHICCAYEENCVISGANIFSCWICEQKICHGYFCMGWYMSYWDNSRRWFLRSLW